jgi:hypothetical protein
MPQIYPDEGLILNLMNVADNGGNGLAWVLWVNDIETDLDTVADDLTFADPTWAKVTLHGDDYTQQLVNLHVGTIQAERHTYTNTSGTAVDVYGYAAIDPVGGGLVLVNRYADAPHHVAIGGTLDLTPMIGDSSEVLTDVLDGGTF